MFNVSKMKTTNYAIKRVCMRTKQTLQQKQQANETLKFNPYRSASLFIKSLFPKKKYQRNLYAEFLEENN